MTTTPATEDTRRAAVTLAAALLGFFVVTLDAVIVNVALPDIGTDVGGGIAGLQWVVDGYTLMFAAFLLSAGSLTDRTGATRAFGLGITAFTVASVVCGLAPGLGALVAFRIVQGTAAAVVMPSSMALIGQAYPDPVKRSRAVATWAMGGAVASTTGPVLGGLLTMASWRWIFLVNVPVGAVALVLLARSARPAPSLRVPFDWAGQVTGVAAVVIGFAFMVGYYGMPFVMSLVLQRHGLSPLDTGIVFLPMMLVGLVLTPLVPRLVERAGARTVVVTGLVLMTLGLVTLALVPAHAVLVAALMTLVGLSGPMTIPPVIAVLLAAVPAHQAGTASGVLNTSRQLGGALAIAVFGALLTGPSGVPVSLLLAAAVAAAAALTAAVGLHSESRKDSPR